MLKLCKNDCEDVWKNEDEICYSENIKKNISNLSQTSCLIQEATTVWSVHIYMIY